jgi:hypothetical protein
VKTADPKGRFRDHSYPVRQGIFSRGNISDLQLLINLFFILTKNALFSIKKRLANSSPKPDYCLHYTARYARNTIATPGIYC